MTYYDPSFANLSSGWYETTTEGRYGPERLACLEWWDDQCDRVLKQYLDCYGMFLSAFDRQIKKEIMSQIPHHGVFPDYFGYFLVSRVLHDDDMSQIYRSDYESRAKESTTCAVCSAQQILEDIHPSLIGRTKRVLPLCNDCWFWLARMTPIEKVSSLGPKLKKMVLRLRQEQTCAICSRKHVWVKGSPSTLEVPLLPGRHIEICTSCVKRALWSSPKEVSKTDELQRLKEISDILGVIPDKSGFVYDQAASLEDAVKVTRLMQTMRPFADIAKENGSWFKLLIAAGILPDGTRRTTFGTMVVANDGHECLSLAEKQVDDLFAKHDIAHKREPQYPGASYKADWLITHAAEDMYVELFGLDGQPAYTKRMKEKIAYAESVGMKMVYFDRRDLRDLRGAFFDKFSPLFPEKF